MTYSDAIQFLYDLRLFGLKLGLENTFKLAALAGNPQNKLRFIHVAGTNGKGSTCAMLESIYRTSGLRVGLFTSPHLVAFGERIQVNREQISEQEIIRLAQEMQTLIHQGWGDTTPAANRAARGGSAWLSPASASVAPKSPVEHPTFFEVVTVMALSYFLEQHCDLVIWETGLGGQIGRAHVRTPVTL